MESNSDTRTQIPTYVKKLICVLHCVQSPVTVGVSRLVTKKMVTLIIVGSQK